MTKKLRKNLWRNGIATILFGLIFLLDKTHLIEHLFGDFSTWILLILCLLLYLYIGYDVLFRAGRNILHGKIFDENFLMTIATIGAFLIGEYAEAVAVMVFYQWGEWFQGYAVGKSRASIKDLLTMAPSFAIREVAGADTTTTTYEEIDPSDIHPGDILLVKPGEKVPTDGILISSETTLDMASLTGESMPREARPGDTILSGSINLQTAIRLRAENAYEDSTVARILSLLENATDKKAPTEQFISRFARVYTPIVTIAAVLLMIVPPLFFNGIFSEWIRRACTFLVISCPCALVISIPLSFFGGIGAASKNGILVKGSTYIETLSRSQTIAFDKTGTLTNGRFMVSEIQAYGTNEEKEILRIAAALERFSTHPLGKAIVETVGDNAQKEPADSVTEISGKGIRGIISGREYFLGKREWIKEITEEKILLTENESENASDETELFLASEGMVLGKIQLSDTLKEHAKEALDTLKKHGFTSLFIVSGDRTNAVKKKACELNVTEYYGDLLPEDKVKIITNKKNEMTSDSPIVFVGDGINDAPVLLSADLGISLGHIGSAAAIEAADIVLMEEDLRKIPLAYRIAKKTMRIVRENIFFALFVKFSVLILGALGQAPLWLAMFADVGVAMIAILNAMRTLTIKTEEKG